MKTFNAIRQRGKKDSLRYMSSFYRRWYYSALVENSFFSPACLIDALSAEPGVTVATSVFPGAGTGKELTFRTYEYSAERHPVVSDLKKILDMCFPDAGIGMELFSGAASMTDVLSQLSLWDPFYVEFLCSTATALGIVEEFPSIHTQKIRISPKKYDQFFARSHEDILLAIVERTIKSVAALFRESAFPFSGMFTEANIRRMLTEPISADDLYAYMLNSAEIPDILDMIDSDALESAFVSETMLVGLLYDKCFLTTFGYYLKLIHPVYAVPYDFPNEIGMLVDAKNDHRIMLASLYMPSSYYKISNLGRGLFGKNAGKPEDANCPFSDRSNVKKALDIILGGGGAEELAGKFGESGFFGRPRALKIYEIKIRYTNDKKMWKNLEIPAQASLDYLFEEICFIFDIDPGGGCSFFEGGVESPFMEYSDKPRRGKFGKAGKSTDVTLEELDLARMRTLLLIIKRKKIYMDILFMKEKEMREGMEYPRVSRQSR
ncbi:MAG: hypothetical protein FWC55_07680 [Firmicutes bacterium]|nr:hypothetical protein [Bacillota bacterium]